MDEDWSGITRKKAPAHQKHDSQNEQNDQSDQQADDLINYKGIYFDDNNEKYIDDSTGAHFRYDEIYQRLLIAKVERKRLDRELNITYSRDSVLPGNDH